MLALQIYAKSLYRTPSQTKFPHFAAHTSDDYYAETELKAKAATRDIFRQVFQKGWLNQNQINSICDFGCGEGQPTEVMKELFPQAASSMIAIDKQENYCLLLSKVKNILPPENVICDDGINFLNKTDKKFDLITAFCLHPFGGIFFQTNFLNAAKRCLNPGGKILICSDSGTMTSVKNICNSNKLDYQILQGDWDFSMTDCQEALIISNLSSATNIHY